MLCSTRAHAAYQRLVPRSFSRPRWGLSLQTAAALTLPSTSPLLHTFLHSVVIHVRSPITHGRSLSRHEPKRDVSTARKTGDETSPTLKKVEISFFFKKLAFFRMRFLSSGSPSWMQR